VVVLLNKTKRRLLKYVQFYQYIYPLYRETLSVQVFISKFELKTENVFLTGDI